MIGTRAGTMSSLIGATLTVLESNPIHLLEKSISTIARRIMIAIRVASIYVESVAQ